MTVIKVNDETLKMVGATGANDFPEKFSAFAANAQTAIKFMSDSQASLDSIAKSIAELKASIPTEDRIKAIVGEQITASVPKAVESFLAGEVAQGFIAASASKKTLEIMGNVGTSPVKASPAPAAGVDTPEQKSAALIAEGKYEEAFKLDAGIQREFVTAKSYAAFMRHRGKVKITASDKEFKRN